MQRGLDAILLCATHHSTNQRLDPAGQERLAQRIMGEPYSMQVGLRRDLWKNVGIMGKRFLGTEITTKQATMVYSKTYLHIHINICILESSLTWGRVG